MTTRAVVVCCSERRDAMDDSSIWASQLLINDGNDRTLSNDQSTTIPMPTHCSAVGASPTVEHLAVHEVHKRAHSFYP